MARAVNMKMNQWVDMTRDNNTQIETIRAHFEGHAYDAHWHDSYLVGVTESGVQQFHSGRVRYRSTPGEVFILSPGEIHDGDAVDQAGFTYRMLYIPPSLFHQTLPEIFVSPPNNDEMVFPATLFQDKVLAAAIWSAFDAIHQPGGKLSKDHALLQLVLALTQRFPWRRKAIPQDKNHSALRLVKEYLHEMATEATGLNELAEVAGMDRYRLSRQFLKCFGLPPHAYLVQVRLSRARQLLWQGIAPAEAAALAGFADQSHMGRWFRRAYRFTPAAYRNICTNVPDD
jgi:AraC-like DNA-binding protein